MNRSARIALVAVSLVLCAALGLFGSRAGR